MNTLTQRGLGTQLRHLLALLDGELAQLYADDGSDFRPRFFPVMQLLIAKGQASVGELAEHLRSSQPAATQTVAEMKRAGLVEVGEGRDRRQRVVTLSDRGLALVREITPIWDATRAAAEELDSELSTPLGAIVAEAIAALEREGFRQRIARHRAHKGE